MKYPDDFINQIICGDCLEIMKNIPTRIVDLIITDPPYQYISDNPKGGGFMANENRKHLDNINSSFGMSFNPNSFLNEAQRILKKFNLYVFTNKTLLLDYLSFARENNYSYDLIIWFKPNPVPINKGHYLIDKEYAVYIYEKGRYFNSNLGYENYFTIFQQCIGGDNKKEFNHPTIKPLQLISRFVKISSDIGHIVLDPFLGSGTTAIACKMLNRHYIGIEINQEYVEMAKNRLNNAPEVLFQYD